MLKCKSTVTFSRFTPALVRILQVLLKADEIFPEDIIITSANDSKHKEGSAHYRDEAVDIRCNDRPKSVDLRLVEYLQLTLGHKFLVLYEYEGTPNEHIHIQLRKGEVWTTNS